MTSVMECQRKRRRKSHFCYRTSVVWTIAHVANVASHGDHAFASSLGPTDYAANDRSLYRSPANQGYRYEPTEEDDFPLEELRSPPPPPPPPRSFHEPLQSATAPSRGRPPPSVSGSTSFSSSSSAASGYNPIHYEFKARREENDMDVEADNGARRPRQDEVPPVEETASARRDVVTRYMSSPSRAAYLRLNAAVVGAALGAFLSKSLVSSKQTPLTLPLACAAAFFVASYFRNPYGELVRALGMTLILVLRQSRQIRRRYPSLRHLRASVRLAERSPFPPSRNPWTYQPREDVAADPEFSMLYALAAMGLVGSFVGGNMPLIPSWMGALAGGSVLAFATTLPTARGDLARCMGMRVVAVAQEAWHLQSELQLLSKAAVVTGKIADKLLILDRKHRIKDRVVSGVSFLYEQIVKATQQRNPDDDADGVPRRRRPPPPLDEREERRRGMEEEAYRGYEPDERGAFNSREGYQPPDEDRRRRGPPPPRRDEWR